MSLSLKAVDHIFDRLMATYGNDFMRRWEGQDALAIKACWAHELAGYAGDRERMLPIAWALENLPEKPPNVIEFRSLCRRAPPPDMPRLPEPKADPQRLAAELAKLAPLKAAVLRDGPPYPMGWARRLLERHERGEKVSAYPLRCAREVLGVAA